MTDTDLFAQINNAVLDLQASELQTFERPLRTLARLLHHPDLEPINRPLKESVDFAAFMTASEQTGGGMLGSHKLVWPDAPEQAMGLTLVLIDECAADPDYATDIGRKYFYTGSNKIVAGIHDLTRHVIIPFARDYVNYVKVRQSAVTKSLKSPEVVTLRPTLWGISIDIKEAWRRWRSGKR